MSNIIKMDTNRFLSTSRMIQPKPFESAVIETEMDPAVKELFDQLILQGKEEARQLIEKANEQAEQQMKAMELEKGQWAKEKKRLSESAWNEGYQQGLEEGRKAGLSEYQDLIAKAREVVDQSKQSALSYIEESEATIMELALASAETILGAALAEYPDYFNEIVKKGLREFKEERSVDIYVHPSRYQVVLGARKALEAVFPHAVKCYIYPNDELHGNDCLIETESGKISAGIGTQLKELKERLTDLLQTGEIR